jgi:hypothetical protein
VTSPSAEPVGDRPRRPAARLLLLLAAGWLLLRVPFLLADAGSRLPADWQQARAAVTQSRAELIQTAIGVSTEIERLLRERLPEDGRLVVYAKPLPEGTAADVVQWYEFTLRTQFERLRNLLYPTPRDAHFARDAGELRQRIESRFEHKLIVVDGTQEDVPLPAPGEFELLTEQRLGPAIRVRFWLLRKAGT